MLPIMASLNLGQDVANSRERKLTSAHIVAKWIIDDCFVKNYVRSNFDSIFIN